MQDALERDLRPLCDGSHRFGRAVELAEDDLVLAKQHRAEIADVDVQSPPRDPRVERLEVGLADVGPEALGDEAAGSVSISADRRAGGPTRKR